MFGSIVKVMEYQLLLKGRLDECQCFFKYPFQFKELTELFS